MEQDDEDEPHSFEVVCPEEPKPYSPQPYTERPLTHAYAITPPPPGIYTPLSVEEEEYKEEVPYSQEYQEEEEGEYRNLYTPLTLPPYRERINLKSLLGVREEEDEADKIKKIWEKIRKEKSTKSKKSKRRKRKKKRSITHN